MFGREISDWVWRPLFLSVRICQCGAFLTDSGGRGAVSESNRYGSFARLTILKADAHLSLHQEASQQLAYDLQFPIPLCLPSDYGDFYPPSLSGISTSLGRRERILGSQYSKTEPERDPRPRIHASIAPGTKGGRSRRFVNALLAMKQARFSLFLLALTVSPCMQSFGSRG